MMDDKEKKNWGKEKINEEKTSRLMHSYIPATQLLILLFIIFIFIFCFFLLFQ